MDLTKMLTEQEAADMLRLPVATVRKLRDRGRLSHERNDPMRIRLSNILNYIERLEQHHSVKKLRPARRDIAVDSKKWNRNTTIYSKIRLDRKQ